MINCLGFILRHETGTCRRNLSLRFDLIEFGVGSPRGTRIQIAFARLRLRLFYAVAEVVLHDAALFFVTDRLRSLSAFAASNRAEAPIGEHP